MTTTPTAEEVQAQLAALQALVAKLQEQTKTAGASVNRRSLIPLPLAVLGGVAAAALAPKPANAQFSDFDFGGAFGGLQSALGGIAGQLGELTGVSVAIRDLLGTAFDLLVEAGISPEFMALFRCVLGSGGSIGFNFDACSALRSLIGGENSMTRNSRIPDTMDHTWPGEEDIPTTDIEWNEATKHQVSVARDQVMESQTITATLAEGQDMLNVIDDSKLEAANFAAGEGSLITVNLMIAHLVHSGNMRLAQIIQSLNASQQTRGAIHMAHQHQRLAEVVNRERMREPTHVLPIPPKNYLSGAGGGTAIGLDE